jgi:Bacterial Ig domain
MPTPFERAFALRSCSMVDFNHVARRALVAITVATLGACSSGDAPADTPLDASDVVVVEASAAVDASTPTRDVLREDAPAEVTSPSGDVTSPSGDVTAPPADASRADVTAPRDASGTSITVRLTAPTNGATVAGVVTLRADAMADVGVARVVFYSQGGGYRIGEDTTAPYTLDWFTAGFVPDGMQRLRAVAIDTAGRQAMSEIVVQVRNPPTSTLPATEVERVTAWFEARRNARYMEGDCTATTWPGWTGVPLKLCRYRVSDVYSGGTRTGEVILADAEPAQLARWVVQAAMERRGRVVRSDVDAICNDIIGQSGAQFPVAGIVYEDMDGTGQRVYPFRNGVTVQVAGLPYATRVQPTAAQMSAYRTAAITFVGRYGRIAGTLPADWTALTGEAVPADRSTWPDTVGRAYRAAWGQDRNALIVAWARANL